MLELRSLRRRLLVQYLLTVGLLLAAAEGALYALFRWSGQRELDAVLCKEVERLASALELGPSRPPQLDDLDELDRVGRDRRAAIWQVLVEGGPVLGRSSGAPADSDLPGVGGSDLPVEELTVANETYGGVPVRAARLRTVRHRPVRPGRPTVEPRQLTFDIRAVLDRSALDAELDRLAAYLAGGFPLALGMAWLGGMRLIRRAVRPVERGFDRERRFAGAASHELRTPLTALRGEIELALRRERTPAEYAAALRRMEDLVARMTGVVEGLLVLTRARAGHLLLGAGKVALPQLRQALADAIRLLPGRERVVLTCTAPDELELAGDALLLALAVRNLVENALVHAPEGPVHVRLSVERRGELRCDVADHGPGIPAAVLVGRNGAAGGESAAGRGGVGLGLSIAHAVVEAHAGRLVLANQPGAGGLATVFLPVHGGDPTRPKRERGPHEPG